MQYATPPELALYVDPDAQQPERIPLATVLLRHASGLVRDATSALVYPVDADGMPTDERVRSKFREATCEHAMQCHLEGIDPRRGPSQVKREIQSRSLSSGGRSETYAAADATKVMLAKGTELHPSAWAILDRAGLISSQVNTRASGGSGIVLQGIPYDPLSGALGG